jgi:hypothetical protein
MTEPLGVTIIVVNYNNAKFVGAAIDSALAQDHPLTEVIVVDDASTDNSRDMIATYEGRVKTQYRHQNGGQVLAQAGSWQLASHPIIIFLDSDDLVYEHAASSVAAAWTSETVKVQYLMSMIDGQGQNFGHVHPKYPPDVTTELLRDEILRTGGSPNSPGSGNAYARSLMERLAQDGAFDIERPRDIAMDAVLELNAPFYGEVLTLHKVLAFYRVHGGNEYAMSSVEGAGFANKARAFERKVAYLEQRCRAWNIAFDADAALDGSIWLQECKLADTRVLGNPSPESSWRILRRAVRACARARLPLLNRTMRIAWLLGVATAPKPVARRLVEVRFIASRRPAWFESMFKVILRFTQAAKVGSA